MDPRDRIYLELANRKTLLSLHAWIGIGVGVAMFLTGAPSPIEADFGPWARTGLGAWATIFGITLFVGTLLSHRRLAGWVALVVGTLGLSVWHAVLMIAYISAAFESKLAVLRPGDSLGPEIANRGYIPLIYLGLFLLVMTHAITLILLDRPRR